MGAALVPTFTKGNTMNMRHGVMAIVKFHGPSERMGARYSCTGLGIKVVISKDYSVDYMDMPKLVAQAWLDKAKASHSYLENLEGVMAYGGNGKYVIIFS